MEHDSVKLGTSSYAMPRTHMYAGSYNVSCRITVCIFVLDYDLNILINVINRSSTYSVVTHCVHCVVIREKFPKVF